MVGALLKRTVICGASITAVAWKCEINFLGNWHGQGDFDTGEFDQTDIVAGSGGRCRGNTLVFVSSGSTVDRLHFLETLEVGWISNSLACLLTTVDAISQLSKELQWDVSTISGPIFEKLEDERGGIRSEG